ncbi:MAG TPA: protein-tyrosine-phosphatase [Vineibacter sp.]|nr:protein-tyrosine-phosphatase [Vineibacter sp.]
MPDNASPVRPPLTPFKVTVCGIADLTGHADAGVTHVLSLLDMHHPVPESLDAFAGVDRELLRFDDVVAEFPGFTACSRGDIERLLAFGERLHDAGVSARHLLVHCHAGISRSTASAAVLMAQFNPGREIDAFEALLDMRPHAWPNTRVVDLADRLLARNGAMLEGLAAYRRALLARKPQLRQVIINIGRGHELP